MQPHTHGLVRRSAALSLALIIAICLNISSPAVSFVRADDSGVDAASSTPALSQQGDASTTPDLTLAPDASSADASSTNATSSDFVATSTQGTGGQTGATIDTGGATASTTAQNNINTNTANDVDGPGETNSSTITASTTDDATLISTSTVDAATGNNIATSTDLATVVTGNAQATANVINEVNTNIFNSDGLILFLNQLFGGGLDLNFYDLSYFFAGGPGASPTVSTTTGQPQCTLLTCLNSSSLNVLDDNTATVTNSVIVRSSTGGNQTSSTGDASIATGDSYAAANVVNLVNTNIVNSSYLLLSFNNFGDLSQNITLPGPNFFNKLFAQGAATTSMNSSTYEVESTSTAMLTGTTTASALTGDNTATSTADASSTPSGSLPAQAGGVVTTGNAFSSATTYNQNNSTNVGGTSVFMVFRVAGAWTGSVVGLPDGLVTQTIPDGDSNLIEVLSSGATTTPQASDLLHEFNSSQFDAMATNTATIENNVAVSSDTGHNQATSSDGTARIATGNSYASANVVNLINTDIVGQNWIFAMFNIFGNMSGNIVFSDGSPNLVLSASADPSSAAPGDTVTYTFTITNTGDADAQDVLLNATFDNTLLAFSAPASTTLTGSAWDVGEVPRGGTRTFSYTAQVGNNFPAGQSATVPLTAAAINNVITSPSTSKTAEADITVTAPAALSSGGGGGGGGGSGNSSVGFPATASPAIALAKTASVATTTASSTVDYKVVVTDNNNAGPLYSATLEDVLYAPDGSVMYDKSWNLDTVNPGDEIDLSYSVAFAASTTPGTYTNVAQVTGWQNHPTAGSPIVPVDATSTVHIVARGEVLGAETATSSLPQDPGACALRLTAYLARGLHNPLGEVMKLQAFLDLRGEALPITGFFGPMTQGAVSRFQSEFASDILAPLGLTQPTGGVYSMTQRKINELACPNQ